MQWLDEFIKPRKAKNNLEAGSEHSDREIGTDSEDNSNTPDQDSQRKHQRSMQRRSVKAKLVRVPLTSWKKRWICYVQ